MELNPVFGLKLKEQTEATAEARPPSPAERPLILAVDDEPEITDSVAALLARDYSVLTANSGDEALALLRENDVSVLLTDQRMPGTTGADLLARALEIAPDATRILFTGYSDIQAVIEAINQGQVYYYLPKPWASGELQAVLSRGLERFRLVTDNRRLIGELQSINRDLEKRVRARTERLRRQNQALREAREQVERLSRTDALTGVANRRHIDASLESEIRRSGRYETPLSVIMVDLDHFKSINDTYGHICGDKVLNAVAGALEASARTTDLVGRYGGEEFLVILPNSDIEMAAKMAERLRAQVAALTFDFAPGGVTASFGVSQLSQGDTLSALVHGADEALYEAKRTGRNRVVRARVEG